jgi:glutamate-ammonia-ligase adenylyltransferase
MREAEHMKPSIEHLQRICPDVDEALLGEHRARLSNRYYERFGDQDIAQHLTRLSHLSPEKPVDIIICRFPDGNVHCTVLAFDYQYEFSLITGILAGHGYSIESGDVFTYAPAAPVKRKHFRTRRARQVTTTEDLLRRRRIVDHFSGIVTSRLPYEAWCSELERRLTETIILLERGDEASATRARHKVNDLVAASLSDLNIPAQTMLFPVELYVNNDEGPFTRLSVIAQDTPAFLYSLTNALALQQLRIEHVSIRTHGNNIEDDIDVTDARGEKIEAPERINELKLCVLLTKQFTYFLANAPNPYAALCRYEQLVETILKAPSRGQWIDVLSNPNAMQDLARMLGTSDFIWEDFIRAQYEALLPMLMPRVGERQSMTQVDTLENRIADALRTADTFEEKCERLNAFKDHEIFMIDLEHIVSRDANIREFSKQLTNLAEKIIQSAADIVYDYLVRRFGIPRSAAGVEAEYTILGLGKFGGVALGYASDIELIFVYSDNGQTDGSEIIDNGEFFHRFAREITQFIHAKREGIFHVDLRLRPHGGASPLASSLESFCRYYGPHGPAHSFEKLALVRLRAVAGSPALGARIERIRDEFIYVAKSVDIHELRTLRQKQFQEKTREGGVNAKFSPGGLVDLEYDVQILQVMHGAEIPSLRTPRIHVALEALAEAGVLRKNEAAQLTAAYIFMRQLINGLRMLRGSAKDLFLPPPESDEFAHLARRMGYSRIGELDPGRRLHIDFETHTAVVRTFVERHFGRESLPGPEAGTIADVIMSDSMAEPLREEILLHMGFSQPGRAVRNLKNIAESCGHDRFTTLAILAGDILRTKPDPDMALNNWERFVSSLDDTQDHFDLLFAQPVRLEILLSIFAGSQFLADTLVRSPRFFEWVTKPEHLHEPRTKEILLTELHSAMTEYPDLDQWRNFLRVVRRREFLRIGTRDMWLGVALQETIADISTVAEAITQAALDRCWHDMTGTFENMDGIDNPANHMCILAFGKLGGRELNYSSDIDLIGVCDDTEFAVTLKNGKTRTHKELYRSILDHLRNDLSAHTAEGYAYRVDFRLRPYGSAGELVPSVNSLYTYYNTKAALWEIQAALKLHPVAGPECIGNYFVNMLSRVYHVRRSQDEISACINGMREASIRKYNTNTDVAMDIKNGSGGIRDIEFLVQGLQLMHAPDHPELLGGNTLEAMKRLHAIDILPENVYADLKNDYIFLRSVEHYLQILEDRQIHVLPKKERELTALAKRILGIHSSAEDFMEQVQQALARVRRAYSSFL